jgi:hypothetical protein
MMPAIIKLGSKIVDMTCNVMWSSGFPATHMLLSHIARRSSTAWAKNTFVLVLFITSAFEITEEFF